MVNRKLVLISTKFSSDFGIGHLKRSINLANLLSPSFYVLIVINNNKEGIRELEKNGIKYIVVNNKDEEIKFLNSISYDLLIVDKRETSFYGNRKGITVGIDNYGPDIDKFDFVISPLPYEKEVNVNFKGLKYLLVDENVFKIKRDKKINTNVKNILISFGGSDPKDLSFFAFKILEEIKLNVNVKIVLGPLYNGKIRNCILPPNFTIENFKSSLYSDIEGSDIVITSFGITAIESIIANRPVFLINPTPYHNSLANILRLPTFVGGDISNFEEIKAELVRFIKSPYIPVMDLPTSNNIFLTLINKIAEKHKEKCPICDSFKDRVVVYRDGYNNIFFCNKDKLLFRNQDYSSEKSYGPDYFITSYKSQYGKTYEEDRPNIDKLNSKRLNIIKRFTKGIERPKLLEVGSALGFFLDMARNNGFVVKGVEISKYGVDYSKNILKLDVINQSFFDFDTPYPFYDVIAMWYFIEHVKDIEKLILKIKSGLKKGGILAISTPNPYGITGRKGIKSYASRIPEDHYYEFSPKALTSILSKHGFKKLKINYTGIHPQRLSKNIPKFLYPLTKFFMRFFGLGDTFEGYYKLVD